ncbi:collagen-like protein [Streptomyces sp. NPDC058992]|uniref:collagen-like protein n=1 Tax=Streptomyces sp. NPDC058992 TaxID=3346688 RepID=UPI0036968CAC
MTRTQHALYRSRHLLWVTAALLFLGGAISVCFLLVDRAQQTADQAVAEADLRGAAVTTLAGDVRALRSQVQARGETPAAPDPEEAVQDLPDRAEVPVPIPGPRGATGPPGTDGQPGSDGRDGQDGADGTEGRPGTDGQDGEPGQPGEKGEPGERGATGPPGPTGSPGPTCPDGYHLEAPTYDPDALVCRRDGAPAPEPSERRGLLSLALDPYRRQYL